METIYCKECSELGEQRNNPYCLKHKAILRAVPMDDAAVKHPIKCLECIEQENNCIEKENKK